MTREDAIKIIQNEYKCVDRECDIERSCGKCPYMIPTKETILQAYGMAIQALSQEPYDAIRRDDRLLDLANAIESDESGYWTNKRISSALRNIEKLPSVTQKSGKWIPVSERLPKENKQVLIQYRTRYRDDVNLFDVTSRADYNYWQGIGREIDVIAWMPLPTPYEPQESEEKE
jgi:hypothetical protein